MGWAFILIILGNVCQQLIMLLVFGKFLMGEGFFNLLFLTYKYGGFFHVVVRSFKKDWLEAGWTILLNKKTWLTAIGKKKKVDFFFCNKKILKKIWFRKGGEIF